MATIKIHKGSVRTLAFHPGGGMLLSGGVDETIIGVDVEGKVIWSSGSTGVNVSSSLGDHMNYHDAAINRIRILDQNLFASGDEDGGLCIWDFRTNIPVSYNHDHTDFISDIVYNPTRNRLLTTSGDGTVAIYDVRKTGHCLLKSRTPNMDDELLSLLLMANGHKVVVGSQEGTLGVFKWGSWDALEEALPGHPNSVDAMVKIDENTICTGSSDGLIRLISLSPYTLLGIVGDHGNFPVERLELASDKSKIMSCSHDNLVRVFDISDLFEADDDDDENAGGEKAKAKAKAKASSASASKGLSSSSTQFKEDGDMDEENMNESDAKEKEQGKDNDDNEEDDSDESEGFTNNNFRNNQKKGKIGKKKGKKTLGSNRHPKKGRDFFRDL